MISLKSKAPAASKVEEGETKGSAGDSKAEPNGTGVAKKKTIWGVGRGRGKKKADDSSSEEEDEAEEEEDDDFE